MQPLTAADPESHSTDLIAQNVAQLKHLFPEAFTEGRIDFDVLRQLLGDSVEEAEEKYGLNWHGKRAARRLALTSSTGTLRPCPAESVDWDTTQNLMIEGDNLEVLKLLQRSYTGKVKLIYIDPPYNTGNDFVYPDDYQDSIQNYFELTGQTTDGKKITSNTEASGRFHTDWLNMLYPRLKLARNLLKSDGVIFISIEQTELSNLIRVMDDIFGEENGLGCLIWRKKEGGGMADAYFATEHEYVLVYAKDELFTWKDESIEVDETDFGHSDERGAYKLVKLAKWGNTARREDRPSMYFPVVDPDGRSCYPIAPDGSAGRWRVGKAKLGQLLADNLVEFQKRNGVWIPYEKLYYEAFSTKTTKLRSILYDVGGTSVGTNELTELFGVKDVFPNPKPTTLLSSFIRFNMGSNDIVLDFFAGSGTTGHTVLSLNAFDHQGRRYILVQLPELLELDSGSQQLAAEYCKKICRPRTIAEITKERLRRAGKKVRAENPMFAGDLGFRVFKLDSSNIHAWDPRPDDLPATLEQYTEHLKADRTEQDILYEVLLKLGFDLCAPIAQQEIAGKTVYSVGAGRLIVCLPAQIGPEDVEPLGQGIVEWWRGQGAPPDTRLILRDGAFADDVVKTNLTAILAQGGLTNVRSL